MTVYSQPLQQLFYRLLAHRPPMPILQLRQRLLRKPPRIPLLDSILAQPRGQSQLLHQLGYRTTQDPGGVQLSFASRRSGGRVYRRKEAGGESYDGLVEMLKIAGGEDAGGVGEERQDGGEGYAGGDAVRDSANS